MSRILFLVFFSCSILRGGDSIRFVPVDLFVDSKAEPLAAYQLVFSSASGGIKIVGIEGGDSKEFSQPPYYDARAMQNERVILAAFSTKGPGELPRGRTRVATIHLLVQGAQLPSLSVKIDAAANESGTLIPVDVAASERKTE